MMNKQFAANLNRTEIEKIKRNLNVEKSEVMHILSIVICKDFLKRGLFFLILAFHKRNFEFS